MSSILSHTDTGYRQVCEHCDGTGEDRDAPGGDGGCPYCHLGVQEIEYDIEDDEDDPACEYCHGDGGDPWCDRILPCPKCGGTGEKPWI